MQYDIAIVGSGICGMCTAISLAADGHRVTLYERDSAPPPGDADAAFFDWQRRGAAQFRHPHAFLGLMCNLIETHYPALLEQFYAAGARRVGFDEMLPSGLKESYAPEPDDARLWVLLCRRATIEVVIRHYVESLPGVEIINDTQVTALLAEPADTGALHVEGFTARRDGADVTVHADIVVDASGRTTRFPRWFAELGAEVVTEDEDAEIVYYTRHYRLRDGQSEPPRGPHRGAGDLGYLKFGVFPGDNGNFAIILCVPIGETALREAVRDAKQFNHICASIPGLEPWVSAERSEGTTDAFGIADIHAVWRHYVREGTTSTSPGTPVATNFFAVGDAALRTNPLYGRGCSTGVMHANILAEVLRTTTDPTERALTFDARTQEELRPIYDASLAEDQRGIRHAETIRGGQQLDQVGSLKKWFGRSFGEALNAAAQEQIHVIRGLMRTFHLLEKPGEFLRDPRIRRTVFRYMLRGRKRNGGARLQPGPERLEMIERINAEQNGAQSAAAT